MSSERFKTLAQAGIPGSQTTIYTAPADKQVIIREMVIANTTGADTTAKLWVNGNVILPFTTVLAGGHGDFDGAITLAPGETVAAQGTDALACMLSIFGVEEPL